MKYRALSVIAAADAPVKKPAPDVYLNALARLAIPAREALAIEDAAIGLRAARAAGLDCLAAWNDYTQDEDFAGALGVAADLTKAVFAVERGALPWHGARKMSR